MILKHLNLQDIQADFIPYPKENELHIWTIPTEDIDNMHKNHSSRVILTKILSYYLGISQDKIILDTGLHGKPFLRSPEGISPIFFNLSHTDGCMVMAFSSCSPVGIDIEYTERPVKMEKMAKRFFHQKEAEELQHYNRSNKKKHFFRLWTQKEAFLKGLGVGLTISPASFYAVQDNEICFQIIPDDKNLQKEYSSWRLQSVPVPENYICSVAYTV